MEYYSWILSFHVMSFLSWMAMLFYLPRLFVYHREHADKEDFVTVVKIQEFKLYKYIGLPAMWATIISGGFMIYLVPELFKSGAWLHVKLTLAIFLIIYSFSLDYMRKKIAENPHYKSGKFFRFYNEVPTLLMIGIVIMVVIKPF
ncbi:Protoporphyrinogen IX oxidase, novel form, HemJ [hydrothermal vent metagenome]|uniref:Protoporphyrinogen IX oxidase, novel form, HemJ n=1 Tax=hydrothermal vent metagenome TaxID=652676 RepID=A0A1W1BHU6_9ZZZZ